jgi:iron-sulfur cluster assembly accessory protein
MITLTENAQKKLKDASATMKHHPYVRLGVVGGGCSGFQYSMAFADGAEPLDKKFPMDGFTVIVDPVSIMYLDGITVGFGESVLQSGFTFDNPNAKRTCGCGSSFEA